ncbi:glycosyltransferase [Flavobacterium sp. KMS]|uniref:glycosyltransferase n=1 Tax=unclassified Flavobacterium TaxID=196869 RepID=UPI000AD8D8F3|nr:glycosyltransferase [Flavobacterium sp. KMS]
MKILEVIASLGAGGAETLLKDLAIGIKKHNHEVLVVIIDSFSNDISEMSKINQLFENGIKVISLNRKPGEKSLFLFFKIYKLLKENKPTLIHIHSFLASIYFFPFAFIFKIKFVQTIHNTHISESKLLKLAYSKLFHLKFKYTYCSDEAYLSLNKIIGEGMVINNGIAFHANQNIREFITQKYEIPTNSLILLNVGRITKQKNQLLLIDLIENLNTELYEGTLYLLICGKHYNDSLYQNIKLHHNQLKFKNNIKFIGIQDNINDLMYSSDLYISSSIHEGLPITVLEAMNTGVPLILSPIKEHLNVFRDLEYCYFPKTNAVSSYVELFKKNEKLFAVSKEEIINKRDSMIKKFSISATVSNYLIFFKNL